MDAQPSPVLMTVLADAVGMAVEKSNLALRPKTQFRLIKLTMT
jgi:hypothetical protein